MSILNDLRGPLAVLLAVLLLGIIGFHSIEHWTWIDSAWMALITVTTIGYGEVHPLTETGRLFGMAYILLAVGSGGYAVAQLTGYVVDGRLQRQFRQAQRARRMKSLRNHYIIVGFGRLGREVVEDLVQEGAKVVVVDPAAAPDRELPAGVYHLRGDGSSDQILLEAGVKHARAIAIATPSSAMNVFVTLSVRQLNPTIYISTRVDDAGTEEKAIRAGANAVVSPFSSAGSRMAHRLLHPHAAEVVEQILNRTNRQLVVDDIRVPEKSSLTGRLSDLHLRERHGVGVIAIRRPDGRLETVPGGESSLQAGDVVVVAGAEDAIRMLRELVEG